MRILTRRTVIIWFTPLQGSLNSKITMMISPLSWPFLSLRGMLYYGMNIWRRLGLEKPSPKLRLGPNSRSIWTRDFYPLLTNKNSTSTSPLNQENLNVEDSIREFERLQCGLAWIKNLNIRLLGSLKVYLLTLLTRWIYNLTYPLIMSAS